MVDPFFNEIIMLLKVVLKSDQYAKNYLFNPRGMVFHILKAEDFVKLAI